jgi:hypothetical protein
LVIHWHKLRQEVCACVCACVRACVRACEVLSIIESLT